MVFFGILTVVIALHIALFSVVNFKDSPHEQPPQSVIEVSFISKSAPIKAKQNDSVIVESQPIAPPPPEPIKPIEKKIAKPIEKKSIVKPIEVKKELPKPKILTVQKSDLVVEKVEKPKHFEKKTEPPKKTEERPKEKPHLSLESIQQQISQVGSEVRQQQVSERDKYINQFSSKVKRIGQSIYDRGTLPAGTLTTFVEINADGTIKNFKITRSSGNKKLDSAVENMVYSAAPYPALPFQLQNEASTLTFTRNWEFYGD
jgi:protein TonB